MRRFWKVSLTSEEILGEQPDRRVVETLLGAGPLRLTLGVLSRAALTLAVANYDEMPEVQAALARLFLPLEVLQRIDDWRRAHPGNPDVYFLGDQHLLTAMTVALFKTKRRKVRSPEGPPFVALGRALAHVAGLLDPLQDEPEFDRLPDDEARRRIAELILRNGLFYDREAYQYTIPRYYEMFCRVVPILAVDPKFVDVAAAFRRATGLKLTTYLRLGLALLASIHRVAARRDGPALLDLETLRPPRHLAKVWVRFMQEVAVTRRRYCRLHRGRLRLSPVTEYNFLAAEKYPIVRIDRKAGCCLSVTFLERKFGPGIMHRLLEEMTEQESGRFRSFLGRVFDRYVRDICERTFRDLFVPGFLYDGMEAGDGWIVQPPEAILIEAKSGFVRLETALSGGFRGFEQRFRETILAGARQLNRVIDDFRAKRFEVGGLGPDVLRIIYPVLVTLRYLPLEKFLWDYVRAQLAGAGLLLQAGVRPLTIMAVKDLELVEAFGGEVLALIRDRLDDAAWRDAPFSNYLFFRRRGGAGAPANAYLMARYQELLSSAALQIFGARLGKPQ